MTLSKKDRAKHLISLILGPIAFAICYLLVPFDGLEYGARICFALYVWMIVWWALKPIPWVATTVLPLLLFPLLGIMKLQDVTAAMFGQRIMFLLMFIFMLGNTVVRVGIGKRMAVNLLAAKWVGGRINRFIIVYMLTAAILQAIFSVVGLIVTMSIGSSVIDYIFKECDALNISVNKGKVGSHIILAGAYGMLAGSMVTIQGSPQNILTLSIYEEIIGSKISFTQWMMPGLICALILGPIVYLVLRLIYRKDDIQEIPNGSQFFVQQKAEMGKMTAQEKRLWVIVGIIIFLWVFSTFVTIPGVDFFWVSIMGMVLLYLVPENPKESVNGFLTIDDLKKINWDNIMLVTGAIGFSGILVKFGLIDYFANSLKGINGFLLIIVAAVATALMTNFLAGMATATAMATLLLPLVATTGVHPLILAKLIAAMSIGLMVPWAGTAAAVTFGSQRLEMKEMVKVGVIMIVVCSTVLIGLNLLLSQIPAWYPSVGA